MARHHAPAGGRHRVAGEDVEGEPTAEEMISTTEAAKILGNHSRTIIRWVDSGMLRGGRPRDPGTGEPVPWSPRWVDARHAVAMAVAAGRRHLIPKRWRYLI